jgi:hypothetical protein
LVAYLNCIRIKRMARAVPELTWASDMADMILLSLFVFCVGGAALSMAYYDVFFIWTGLLSALLFQLRQPMPAKDTNPAVRTSPQSGPAFAQTD